MKRAIPIAVLCAGILVIPQKVRTQDSAMTKSRPAGSAGEYTVKKGDTLWDISAEFLDDPFQWPDIWHKNPFIADPHWIYPGQSLTLSDITGRPVGEAAAISEIEPPEMPESLPPPEPRIIFGSDPRTESDQSPAPLEAVSVEKVRTPRLRSASAEEGVIRTFNVPRPVYTAESYMRTGFISLRSDISPYRVISMEENGNATSFDHVVIDMGADDPIDEGDLLAVATIGDRVRHPDSGEDMGVVVRMRGYVRVEQVGKTSSRCRITRSFDPMNTGDIVMPARIADGGMFDAYIAPDTEISGAILAVNEPMLSIHTHDILYIDRGGSDGVRGGDRFTIFNRASADDSNIGREPIGEVEAVNVMENQTAVVVVTVTETAIGIGDRVELTARCRRID